MYKLSEKEIITILQNVNEPQFKAVLNLINKGIDVTTSLFIGMLSVALDKEQAIHIMNESNLQKRMPKTADLS